MNTYMLFVVAISYCKLIMCKDEDKISKACYWPNEIYEPCFGGCAEISCDNPRNHLRPCYPYCEPGCVCEEPYVRDDRSHQCVLPQDCSPTQMGIPVPNRRSGISKNALKPSDRHRGHAKREDDIELNDNNAPNHADEMQRGEVSRMGNYFNIVIAPPPIRSIQPRKTFHNEVKAIPVKTA